MTHQSCPKGRSSRFSDRSRLPSSSECEPAVGRGGGAEEMPDFRRQRKELEDWTDDPSPRQGSPEQRVCGMMKSVRSRRQLGRDSFRPSYPGRLMSWWSRGRMTRLQEIETYHSTVNSAPLVLPATNDGGFGCFDGRKLEFKVRNSGRKTYSQLVWVLGQLPFGQVSKQRMGFRMPQAGMEL